MADFQIRPVREGDAPELSTLLNEIIARGGTTAWEDPFDPELLDKIMLAGTDVIYGLPWVALIPGSLPLSMFVFVALPLLNQAADSRKTDADSRGSEAGTRDCF